MMVLLVLGTLLPGCTTLTEEMPAPSETTRHSVRTDAEPSELSPLGGYEEVFRFSEKANPGGGGELVDKEQILDLFTCQGTDPVRVTLSDGSTFDMDCENRAGDEAASLIYENESRQHLDVRVEAGPQSTWQVLVTRQKK